MPVRQLPNRDLIPFKQVTRGYNIVANGWAGVYNPPPHPHTPQMHIFTRALRSDGLMVQRINRHTLVESLVRD